jgi:hypothetical protein
MVINKLRTISGNGSNLRSSSDDFALRAADSFLCFPFLHGTAVFPPHPGGVGIALLLLLLLLLLILSKFLESGNDGRAVSGIKLILLLHRFLVQIKPPSTHLSAT